jgi:transcriptional regulator with XRE-family HTH domain
MNLMQNGAPLAYPRRVVVREQIRAARGLLGWSQRDLAAAANQPISAVKAFESGRDVRVSVMTAIEAALIDVGLMFLEAGDVRDGGRGVRFRR